MMTKNRMDLFTTTHKALRAMMSELQLLSGRADYDNTEDFAEIKEKFESLWQTLHYHAVGEDKFIFLLLEKVNKARFNHLDATHHTLDPIMNEIEKQFKEMEGLESKGVVGSKFYTSYNKFLSDYYVHIKEEEECMPIFWDHYTDDVLGAEYMKMPSVIPPDISAYFANYLFKSINKMEGWKFLENVKNNAPPPVFTMFMGVAEKSMPETNLQFVKSKLE